MAVKFGPSSIKLEEFGIGPGNVLANPRFTTTYNVVATPSNIEEIVDKARQYGMCIPVNLSGNRGAWTDTDALGCKIYNAATYESNVRRFSRANLGNTLYEKVLAAFLDKTLIAFVGDELHASGIFCGSMSKADINDMALLHKEVYPGCITAVRSPANQMSPPQGGWTGLDYVWAQYQFKGNPCGNTSLSAAECYASQVATADAMDVGVIAGINWINDKSPETWDHDLNPGTAEGHLTGLNSAFYIMPPEKIRQCVDAVRANTDLAPIMTAWTHIHPDFTPQEPFHTYEIRSDFVAEWRYALNTLSQPSAHAWRTAKGADTGGGDPGDPEPGEWTHVASGAIMEVINSVSQPVYFPTGGVIAAGDLMVLVGYSREGGAASRTMGTPSGWSLAKRVAGDATYGDLAICTKIAAGTEGGGTVGEGTEYVTTTWSGTSNAGNTQIAFILVYRGVLQSGTILDVAGADATWAASDDLGPITGITPLTEGALALVIGARQNDFGNGTPAPAGTLDTLTGDSQTWADPIIYASVKGDDAAVVVTHSFLSGTPAITNKTYSSNVGPSTAAGCGVILTFKPQPGTVSGVPVLAAIGAKSAVKDTELTFTATATGGGVTYSLSGTPPTGAAINATTGVFTFTPTAVGSYSVTVVATNSSGTDSETVVITVRDTPVLTAIGSKSGLELAQLSFTAVASGGDITYSLGGTPPTGAAINGSSGLFTWTPVVGQGGTYNIQVVSTNVVGSDSETITVVITGVGPELTSIGAREVNEGDLLRIACSATNPNLGTLVFSLTGSPPSGASITSDGVFTWEPGDGTAGAYSVTVEVTDGTYTDSETFAVTVTDVVSSATTAVITGLVASTSYDVRIAHLDPDTANLGFWATGEPYTTTTGAVPTAPTLTAASAISKTGLTVNWTNGATGVGVTTTVEYRQAGAAAWIAITGIASGVVAQALTGLVAGTVYEVRVKHVDTGVSSAYDVDAAYATTTASPPSVGTPTNLTFTQGGA